MDVGESTLTSTMTKIFNEIIGIQQIPVQRKQTEIIHITAQRRGQNTNQK